MPRGLRSIRSVGCATLAAALCVCCGASATPPALKGGVYRLKDINPTGSSGPAGLMAAAGKVFFTADDGTHGCELWVSDGTEEGTHLVKDVGTKPEVPCPRPLAVRGASLFFDADGGLWVTDGSTEGTVLLRPFPHGLGVAGAVGDTVFFGATDPPYGNQLWKSDGTPEGTLFVVDTPDGPDYPLGFTAFKGAAYFFAQGGAHHLWLWRTDGTPAGTFKVQWVADGVSMPPLVKLNDQLFFTFNGVLWRSDGTRAGTIMMVEPQSLSGELAEIGGRLFIACDTYQRDQYELWRSDGTEPGTVMVHRFAGATYEWGIWAPHLTVVRGQLFFSSDDGVHGDELWRSDGTAEGTVLVADINRGRPASRPAQLLAFGDQLFLLADDGLHGSELWKSDGTPEGTSLVRDICRGASGSSPGTSGWGVAGHVALFAANDGVSGNELWALAR